MSTQRGVAGRIAAAFIDSPLTPLFVVAAIGLGIVAVLALPREEEPQIIVPMIDVFVQMPGASPAEVEQRVTRPLEKLLWEMPGVEYLYSTSSPGLSLVVVRFYVGQGEEPAIVRLNQKIAAHMDLLPPGVSPPLVKPRSIDDVPIMAVTLWGPEHDDHELRLVAGQVHDAIKEVPDVSEVTIHGGRPRQVTVDLEPARLASYDVDPLAVQRAIVASNTLLPASAIVSGNARETVEAGTRLAGVDAVRNVVVRANGGQALRVRDVASVRDGDGEPDSYVTFHSREEGAHPAVTIAVAKRQGTNAVDITNRVEHKLESLRGQIVPASIRMTITRNYGDTAREKSNELLWHMLLAVLSVSALIWFALGRREAVVVLLAIPVTLALTLFVFYVYGYTLNRITLFALIFSIGILVDDAIVVVENVARHVHMRTREDANERQRVSLASGAGHGAPTSEPVGESEGRSPSEQHDAIVVVENVARHVRMRTREDANERQRVSLASGAGHGAPASEPVGESEGRSPSEQHDAIVVVENVARHVRMRTREDANERQRVSLASGAGHGAPASEPVGESEGRSPSEQHDAIVVVENVARHVRMRTREDANERQRVSLASGAGHGAPASEPVGESEGRSPSEQHDAIVVVENVARHVRMRTREDANERQRVSLASGAGHGAPTSEPVGESEGRSPSEQHDAIVVVENVARHVRMRTREDANERQRVSLASGAGHGAPASEPVGESEGRSLSEETVRAVDEVGNPTILATFTVVAAVLPNAFVGGLSGPYMRPIPVGASAAMMFSLLVAFIVTPWAASRLLSHAPAPAHHSEDVLTRMYRRAMRPLIARVRVRWVFLVGVGVLLLSATSLVPLGWVSVKMLPFDNKNEFQVIVDMPEGTPLEETARVAAALADRALDEPTVTSVQTYTGTAAPYNFNGLVRHYFLRRSPHMADVQVNLVRKGERSAQSHEIAKRVRTALVPVAHQFGATIQVAEVPPGPPVLQTLVAEVYGPDEERRLALAREVRRIFEQAPGVVDVDWYVEDPQPKWRLEVDAEKSAAAGLNAAAVASVVRMAGHGEVGGLLHDEQAREDVPIVLRLPRSDRASLEAIQAVRLVGTTPVAVGEITRPSRSTEAQSIYHKNLLPVTYVTGDVAGVVESPVYAILRMNEALDRLSLPEGYRFEVFTAAPPTDSSRYAMKWDGEWHITYEVFRDLGLAFAAVLVLIYILVVGWFRSFVTPITIMAAIPFSLIGILPAHAALGAFFTATSMIGFIGGAGIVVRNSVILVDFIELRLADGMPLEQAVIEAGALRFRPMALTAAAVVIGAGVLLFDPIFQGLAISLMAGEIASLFLSRVTVPVLYYMTHRRRRDRTVPTEKTIPAVSSSCRSLSS